MRSSRWPGAEPSRDPRWRSSTTSTSPHPSLHVLCPGLAPGCRRYIQTAPKSAATLARELGVALTTIYKWKRAGRPRWLPFHASTSPEQEALIAELRTQLRLSLDDHGGPGFSEREGWCEAPRVIHSWIIDPLLGPSRDHGVCGGKASKTGTAARVASCTPGSSHGSYHGQTNGMVERFNRRLSDALQSQPPSGPSAAIGFGVTPSGTPSSHGWWKCLNYQAPLHLLQNPRA